MKEYGNAGQRLQKLGSDVNHLFSKYFRYAQYLGRDLLSALYDTPEKRNPYYRNNRRKNLHEDSDYGKFVIPSGVGYPELKPVGSYI